jgi:hypothetical protein
MVGETAALTAKCRSFRRPSFMASPAGPHRLPANLMMILRDIDQHFIGIG